MNIGANKKESFNSVVESLDNLFTQLYVFENDGTIDKIDKDGTMSKVAEDMVIKEMFVEEDNNEEEGVTIDDSNEDEQGSEDASEESNQDEADKDTDESEAEAEKDNSKEDNVEESEDEEAEEAEAKDESNESEDEKSSDENESAEDEKDLEDETESGKAEDEELENKEEELLNEIEALKSELKSTKVELLMALRNIAGDSDEAKTFLETYEDVETKVIDDLIKGERAKSLLDGLAELKDSVKSPVLTLDESDGKPHGPGTKENKVFRPAGTDKNIPMRPTKKDVPVSIKVRNRNK